MRKIALLIGFAFIANGLVMAADHPSKKLFETKCASCHGKNLKGNPALAKTMKLDVALLDMTDASSSSLSDEEMLKITNEGHGKMPAYAAKLKADEIKGLIDYIRSVVPKTEKK